MRTPVMALALCLSVGCGAVLSTHPVGGEAVALEPGEWEGTWIGDEGPLEIRVVEPAAGRLELAWIDQGDEGFRLETVRVELRRLEDWTIGSVQGIDPDDERYLWLRVELAGSQLLGWLPDEGAFERLVASGALPGTAEGGEVVLARLEPAHLATIRRQAEGPLFVWDEPLVLRRLGN